MLYLLMPVSCIRSLTLETHRVSDPITIWIVAYPAIDMSTSVGYHMLKFIVANDVIKADPPQIYGRFLVRSALAVRLLGLSLYRSAH